MKDDPGKLIHGNQLHHFGDPKNVFVDLVIDDFLIFYE